jgi:3-hydroxybutyryl-CoA dehydrogenase
MLKQPQHDSAKVTHLNNLQVAIIGCGQMGKGIAAVCAQAGYKVMLHDPFEGEAERALSVLLDKAPTASLQIAKSLDDIADYGLVIEAIKEDDAIKQKLFKNLSNLNSSGILATNTSSLSIQRLATQVANPERFIGMHFMNPVQVMPLVEVIAGKLTDARTIDQTLSFCKSIGKTVIQCQDQPGFIVNRILLPMINQAIYALESGLASAEDIDTAMKLGGGFPMGPLALADFIGLDTCLVILQALYYEGKNLTFPPSELLVQKVKQGHLGKKAKQGFFTY